MVDQANDAAEILMALRDAWLSDISTKDVPLKVMGLANSDPNKALGGWVGMYVNRATYRPRTAGAGSANWEFDPEFKILCQASDRTSSQNAYVRLEALITKVVNLVFANANLFGKIDGTLAAIDVAYGAREDDANSLFFEGAVLTLSYFSRSKR